MIIHSRLRLQMRGSNNGVFFRRRKGSDGRMEREQEKEQQGGKHLMRRWERGEGMREVRRGKYREWEREMMGIIRIKMVGFGQSRVRATVFMPTSYPPLVPSSGLNQLNWHMQGASMTHKLTTGVLCTWHDLEAADMSVAADRIFKCHLILPPHCL